MEKTTISRRDIFKLIAATSATGALMPPAMYAQKPVPASPGTAEQARKPSFTDPDFQNREVLWETPLGKAELATLTVLCDIIIPGDADAPPPSKIGLADFINEWIGAPYDQNVADQETIRGGLAWLNTHSKSLHSTHFTKLTPAQQTGILDSISAPQDIPVELAPGAAFFRKLRMLTLGGYYSHSSTWKSLGYIGNVPIAGAYPGVPDEILKILGVENEW